MNEYRKIKRELEHEGAVVKFYTETLQLPNSNIVRWDFLEHRGAAAIIPVDHEGKIIMVRQYRNAVERYTLEIPAGGLNAGEDTLTCATRELEEETGYRSDNIIHLIDIDSVPAYCNEALGVYYTKDLIPSKQNLDEDEFVSLERYSMEELVAMIFKGEIRDGKTIASLLAYKTKMGL